MIKSFKINTHKINPGKIMMAVLALVGCLALSLATTAAGTNTAAAQGKDKSHATVKPASIGAPAAPSSITSYTDSELFICAAVALKSGFRFYPTYTYNDGKAHRPIAVAIAVALKESTCNPSATGYNGSSKDRGLWQINNVAHPEVSDTCAYQIQCNGNAAWKISNYGLNWSPWSVYTSGAWTSAMSQVDAYLNKGFAVPLQDSATGKCVAAVPATASGGDVVQKTCSQTDNTTRWLVQDVSGHNPVLKNVSTGYCLRTVAAEPKDNGDILQFTCNTSTDGYQQWWVNGSGKLNTNGNAEFTFQNHGMYTTKNFDSCLDAASTTGIVQLTCNAADKTQVWN